jgi:hypothetical protein
MPYDLVQGSLPIKITAIYLAFTIERLKIMEIFLKLLISFHAVNCSATKALFNYLYNIAEKILIVNFCRSLRFNLLA